MGLESKAHGLLSNFPLAKKIAKRIYQGLNVIVFRPKKSDGKIRRITPNDGYEYLFGYYDKSPWDASGRYMLALRVKEASKKVAPKAPAEIVLIDTEKDNLMHIIAKTNTWNVQQGCMLGWLGPDFKSKIFYNDFRDDRFCSIIKNLEDGTEKVIDASVYTVSNDGKFALTLDFARLHTLRPGYGYSNTKDMTKKDKIPDGPCVCRVDFVTGEIKPILTYKQLKNFEHRDDMDGAYHKVNHLMLSPDGKRFMVIHRWLKGGKKISRLLTCDVDGKNLYNLSDDNMVSHCYWKNNKEILAYCRKNGKNGYFLMKDQTHDFEQKWEFLTADGHPSYSPDGNLVVTDTYPNRKRISTLRILTDTTSTIIGKVYAPFKYDNNTRCDLHPRWSRDGKKICFDGCFEGKRAVYVVDVEDGYNNKIGSMVEKKGKIKLLFVLNACKDRGPTRVDLNIIKNLDYSKFEPMILTFSEENESDSILNEVLPYITKYVICRTNKIDIMRGNLKTLKDALDEISPDVIHTTGVFPDYAISKISSRNQVVTMHNYASFDYVKKFGRLRGWILVKMQYYAARHARKAVACSKSLTKLYNHTGLELISIQNGIDTKTYHNTNNKEKLREKFNINKESFVFVYTGRMAQSKNVNFALESFVKAFNGDEKVEFILLGDGSELAGLKQKYESFKNISFMGSVKNVSEYLGAADVYISASKSEGMPNGVLEAMACGLPVLLSDIPQHEEIINSGEKCGYCFSIDHNDELVSIMKKMINDNIDAMAKNARTIVTQTFSAFVMSEKYQKLYTDIATNRRVTLFISSLSGGGAERVTCNLANYLNKNNYAVDVITMSNKKDTYKLDDGVTRICLLDEKERASRLRNLKLRRERLKRYVIHNREVACYVVMLPITIFMLIRLRKITKSKIIISERNNPASYGAMERMMMRYSAKRCDGLVVQTKEIGKWYKNVKEKFIIPNAINDDIVFPKRKNIEKKIVAVGRLEEQKNYPMLIKAFAIFSKEHPDYILEIYGEGEQEPKIKKMVKKLGLDKKVRFMGYVDNVSERIAEAACFAMSSNFEGMPNALIEAMCIGLPCVAVDCDGGGVRELIKNGVDGFIVEKGDAKELAVKLAKVVDDDKLAAKLSENALEMRKKLKSDKIYSKWVSAIKKVSDGA